MDNNKTNQAAPSASEINSGKGMAVLSYITILALIPYFAEKNNKYVRFHAVQGMNLFLIWIAYAIINTIVTSIVSASTIGQCVSSIYRYSYASCAASGGALLIVSWIFGIIGLAIGVVAIIGIVNAATGKMKELPILGKIKIIKK